MIQWWCQYSEDGPLDVNKNPDNNEHIIRITYWRKKKGSNFVFVNFWKHELSSKFWILNYECNWLILNFVNFELVHV